MEKPKISIVLGSCNRRTFLKKAITSIRENGITVPYEIIVIDAGSTDGSLRYLTTQKDVITIIQHNLGTWKGSPVDKKTWGYYMNIAFQAAHGKYIVMISDDCLLIPGAVMNSYHLFEGELDAYHKVGAIAFYWRNYGIDKYYSVRQTLGHKLAVNHGMFLKAALEDIGYCEEDRYPFYYGDGNLSLKFWEAGYSIIPGSKSFLEHYYFASLGDRKNNSDERMAHEKRYFNDWTGTFYDPEIDNQYGKILSPFIDETDTARMFRQIPSYHTGLLLSKFLASFYVYDKKRPDRLPSIEMLDNPLNIEKIYADHNLTQKELHLVALVKNKEEVLTVLPEHVDSKNSYSFPHITGENSKLSLTALAEHLRGILGTSFDIDPRRTVGQLWSIHRKTKVIFIEFHASQLLNKEHYLLASDRYSWVTQSRIMSKPEDMFGKEILSRLDD